MKYTRVRRAVSAVMIDSYDEDRNPEHIKVNGRVTFTPLLKDGDVVQWAGPNGPESLVLAPIECRISDGIIMHRGGEGVYLAAGGEGCEPSLIQWKATFSGMQAGGWSFKLKPVMFDAVPDGEVDLTMVAPVAGASEPIVRGPAGTGIDNIKVDGAELVITARSEAGVFEMARIPLDDVVRAEADAAAAAAVDGVETVLAATVDAANAARDDAKGHADRAEDAASTATSAAGESSQSRDAAATSETNAAQSEANADAHRQAAATSASNAATSEANAQDSATAAAESASEAAAHADRAEQAADPTVLRDEITQQLADLVDGAPEDLDTIREVAEYAQENRYITDALNAAIGNKANKTHTHKVEDVADMPAIDYRVKGSAIVQRLSSGQIAVPETPVGNGYAASKKYVDDTAFPVYITNIGRNADLNTYTKTGVYHQNRNVDAANGKNYPIDQAGLLEVFNSDAGMIYQRYTNYGSGNKVFTRGLYNGQWSAWKELSTEGHTHTTAQVKGLDDALAGKADVSHSHSQYATTTQLDGVSGRVSSLEDSAPIIVSSLPSSPLPGRIYLVTE